jgi:hypothetical protein
LVRKKEVRMTLPPSAVRINRRKVRPLRPKNNNKNGKKEQPQKEEQSDWISEELMPSFYDVGVQVIAQTFFKCQKSGCIAARY